jgi:osmotically-inducible protein OsmY
VISFILVVSRFASLLLPALPLAAEAPPAKPRAAVADAAVDDASLALDVAAALLRARIGGVQIVARRGRITLKGVVEDAAAARRALQAAQTVAGVREVEDRLVSAKTFGPD